MRTASLSALCIPVLNSLLRNSRNSKIHHKMLGSAKWSDPKCALDFEFRNSLVSLGNGFENER